MSHLLWLIKNDSKSDHKSENVQGVCAQYDFDIDNEYELENGEIGTQLEYENRWVLTGTVPQTTGG